MIAFVVSIVMLSAENADLKRQLDEKPTGGDPPATSPQNLNNPGGTAATTTTVAGYTDEPPVTIAATLASPHAHLFPELYAQPREADAVYTEDGGGTIYLTFDDGPHNSRTVQVLNYLQQFGVKATFFVVPRASTFSETTLKRIHNEGHSIGVHSFSHDYSVIYANVEAFLDDFNKARNMIYEQTGVLSDFYRFPGGSINDWNRNTRDDIIAEMNRRGFVYFDWNVDSEDSAGASFSDMYRNVPLRVAENREQGRRSMILFHDAGANTTRVIDDLIILFQRDGRYKFETIDMNVRPMQW